MARRDADRTAVTVKELAARFDTEHISLRPDGTNPRKHIPKYPENKRERFLSVAELRRVGEVLREMEAEGLEMPSGTLPGKPMNNLQPCWEAEAVRKQR